MVAAAAAVVVVLVVVVAAAVVVVAVVVVVVVVAIGEEGGVEYLELFVLVGLLQHEVVQQVKYWLQLNHVEGATAVSVEIVEPYPTRLDEGRRPHLSCGV